MRLAFSDMLWIQRPVPLIKPPIWIFFHRLNSDFPLTHHLQSFERQNIQILPRDSSLHHSPRLFNAPAHAQFSHYMFQSLIHCCGILVSLIYHNPMCSAFHRRPRIVQSPFLASFSAIGVIEKSSDWDWFRERVFCVCSLVSSFSFRLPIEGRRWVW